MRSTDIEKANLNYIEWNNQIAKYFFNSEKTGTRVWLSVEQELIDEIAQNNKVNPDSFIQAVKKGPDCINRSRQTICSKASAIHDDWRIKEGFEYPPYIAYLALFVLAVNYGNSDDFSENNYYGRLGEIVKENLTTTHFQKTVELWDDLESWSLKDKKSDFGEFHNDTVGKNFYVGIPSYQVVLKTEDKKNLSDIFWKVGWDSDSSPTDEEILKALKDNKSLLSNRTIKRIEKGKADFLSVLTDRVLEELRDYDEDEQGSEDTLTKSVKRGTIEICLDIDETAKRADFSFLCKRKSGLPEESFMLKHNNSEYEVVPSSSIGSKRIEQFKIDDWKKDLDAESKKYKFHYKGEKYKIFTPADHLGLTGWISGQRPLPNKFFYIVAHNSLTDRIQKWGQSECDKCHKLDFKGLPREWNLFKIKGINGDKGIKKDIPALAIDERPRIKFEGGIRLKQGSQFFNFAPPKISVVGGTGQISVPVYQISNQKEIPLKQILKELNIFNLPDNISSEDNIKIKIKLNESDFEIKKNLKLVENRLKKFHDYSNQQRMNCFGEFKKFSQENPDKSLDEFNVSETEYLTGAYCHGFKSKSTYPKLPHFSFGEYKKIYLVGHTPGQIAIWPANPCPELWSPVWMIQFKTYKKATAFLIGNIEKTSNREQDFPKEQIKLWRKIVWTDRKRIKAKSQKQWELWTKRAKNV